jgi:hypothetical protein
MGLQRLQPMQAAWKPQLGGTGKTSVRFAIMGTAFQKR